VIHRPGRPAAQIRLEGIEIEAFAVEKSPEALDEDVFHPVRPAVHVDADLGIAQHAGEDRADKLATLVCVEDFQLAKPGQRFLQRRDAKVGIHLVRQPPGEDLAGRLTHDRHSLQETTTHRDVCHIGTPDVIGPLDRQLVQHIRIDPVLSVRVARAQPLVDRCETHLRDEPPHPTATSILSIAAQMPRHLVASMSRAIHEGLVDNRHQRQRVVRF
jgi:hypothetical protein